MRTRNADNPKSPPPPPKRTLPTRKSASKTPPTAPAQPPSDVTVTPKRTRGKAVTTTTTPETPVEEIKITSPGSKSGTKRTVKRVVKRTVIRKKTKSTSPASVKVEEDDSGLVEDKESLEEVKDEEPVTEEEVSVSVNDAGLSVKDEELEVKDDKDEELSLNDDNDVGVSVKDEEMEVKDDKDEELSLNDGNDVGVSVKDDMDVVEGEDAMKDVEDGSDDVQTVVESFEGSLKQESSEVVDVAKSVEHQGSEVDEKGNMETEEKLLEIQEPNVEKEEVVGKETKETDAEEPFEIKEPAVKVGNEEPDVEEIDEGQEITMEKEKSVEIEQVATKNDEDKVELENEPVDMEKDFNDELKGEDSQERVCLSDEEKDRDMGNDDEDEVAVDKVVERGEVGFQEEHEEVAAAAEERRIRKEFEVFVGGLDRDASEEDVRKVFLYAGEVVEVRMHKELPSNKNKGYAFVRFSKKEEVARALAEMKNPVIRGKRCGTAPSEDNDTLFMGNICNTWTKEAIKQKLKDYGVEGVERITLVADPLHEGLSRGFAFLEFSGHPDAMLAYKRLQKPDAIFGHPDRTVKVAFAEPLREPDPNVLAQVKSVFVDGLPPHWDEDIVRNHLKGYGSIERVMLARNMSSAKRKDFGFIDFTTHEAALTCIDGINKRELGDEKTKVRARLSNPLPKTQAVKGGIAGGFRIGQGSGATFPRAGRSFGRGALPSNRVNFQRGRGLYQPGHGQTSRTGFAEDYQPAGPHPPFRGRHNFGSAGGRWDNFRGPHQQPSGQGTVPPRYDVERSRHGTNMNHGHSMGMRGQPYMPDEGFNRPYSGRPYEDPYNYGDPARGVKRPYFDGSDYTESSRHRPRLDYPDPSVSAPGTRFRGGGSGGPSRDYYNYDYSSYYGGERPYGNDRPYGDDRPFVGGRPYGGAPPYGGGRSYGGDQPYGGDRPYGGEQSYGSRYHY